LKSVAFPCTSRMKFLTGSANGEPGSEGLPRHLTGTKHVSHKMRTRCLSYLYMLCGCHLVKGGGIEGWRVDLKKDLCASRTGFFVLSSVFKEQRFQKILQPLPDDIVGAGQPFNFNCCD